MTSYPLFRGRRMRQNVALRRLAQEHHLAPAQLILPLFVVPGHGIREPVGSMPGVARTSVDEVLQDAASAVALGLGGIILFGIPEQKDAKGTDAWIEDGMVQQATRAIKAAFPDLLVITDVCLCEYTDHGHCGLLDAHGHVQNDPTLDLLARTAVSHAAAGADLVAPSDMMDGRVRAIRHALDAAGFPATPILSYAAKYASAFYGPFRDAADSAPAQGDRRGYQMDPPNAREAIREVMADLEEGADMIMVKPALPYLDVLRTIRDAVMVPVAAYQVSGEYAALQAAAANGWLDGPRAMDEALQCIHRAGADVIVTYAARDFAHRWRALHGLGGPIVARLTP